MSKEIERVQTGVRLEKQLLNVLKALAAALDLSLGDLLEGVVLHAFEGKPPFGAETLRKIEALRDVYGLDLRARDAHRLVEPLPGVVGKRAKKPHLGAPPEDLPRPKQVRRKSKR